jgi:hypothetical protein
MPAAAGAPPLPAQPPAAAPPATTVHGVRDHARAAGRRGALGGDAGGRARCLKVLGETLHLVVLLLRDPRGRLCHFVETLVVLLLKPLDHLCRDHALVPRP